MYTNTIGFTPPNYLEQLESEQAKSALVALRAERDLSLITPNVLRYREAVAANLSMRASLHNFDADVVQIGRENDLSAAQNATWQQALEAFRPWKKGPFSLFGTEIDAEWRSDWKWQRILPHIAPLQGRRVADIGCHNGYFMFRMAAQQPKLVIGIEPVAKHFWNFQLLQNVVQQPNLVFELFGVEHMDLYPSFFDTIFCLGILYHHTDPVGLCRKMLGALGKGGQIIVDCQGIPGDEPIALTPRRRYANARGIWFLPTQSCLGNWMTRAGFVNVRCIFAEPLSVEEQRRTMWADVDSLAEFLDPADSSRTIEGYPAPWRYYVVAEKP